MVTGNEIPEPSRRIAGIVFCGGRSTRMGTPKERLTIDGESLLLRTIRALPKWVEPVIVSARPGQELPALSEHVRIVRDSVPDSGPLAALNDALTVIDENCEAALAVACDMPNISGAFLQCLVTALGADDAVIPHDGERWHPLAALYRRRVQPLAARLVAQGRRSMRELIDMIVVRRFTADDWPGASLSLVLRNVNTQAEYADALRASAARHTVMPP